MDIATLKTFCSSDPSRNRLSNPWSEGDYSYATNGYLMVRVDRFPDIPNGKPVTLERMEEYFNVVPETPLLIIKYKKQQCGVCEGSGRISRCPECNGLGMVTFDNAYNNYEVDCKTCDGEGSLVGGKEKCQECNGEGKIIDKSQTVDLDGVQFMVATLEPIFKLPNVKIFVRKECAPATFSFDGGMGIVMPMKV